MTGPDHGAIAWDYGEGFGRSRFLGLTGREVTDKGVGVPARKKILDRLTLGEGDRVWRELLRRHPGLEAEAATIATEVLADVSVDEVRTDVADLLVSAA